MCATSYTVGPHVYQVTRRPPEAGTKGTRASPCRVERRWRVVGLGADGAGAGVGAGAASSAGSAAAAGAAGEAAIGVRVSVENARGPRLPARARGLAGRARDFSVFADGTGAGAGAAGFFFLVFDERGSRPLLFDFQRARACVTVKP